MAHQTPLTVKTALERIHRHEYVIPAIQREFVWSPDQICQLFDSLLRKYPIGTFLFWRVPDGESADYSFYDVVRDYHELTNRHSAVLSLPDRRGLTAILDGQQRLTSLNLGLLGSYTVKRVGARATASDAYPVKRLHLDLCYLPSAEEDLGVQYMFKFMSDVEAAASNTAGEHYWMLARQGLEIPEGREIHSIIQRAGLAAHPRAYDALYSLWDSISQQKAISYFELEDNSLDEVLDIFVRVNSGGTVLSKSDLLLSVATAQFKKRDAREAVHALVDDINRVGHGFNFSKDIVLKAGLVLTDRPDVRFAAVSFTSESMNRLDEAWDGVDSAVRVAVRLLASFGLSAKNMTANSVLVPVADYLHHRGLGDEYVTQSKFQQDRAELRTWVIRSLVKQGIWGSALDSLLIRLRRVIRSDGATSFPRLQIEREMSGAAKSLDIGKEELDDLVDSAYKQPRSFLLLSLLYPGVDTRNEFHVDHIFPKARFTDTRLRAAGISGDQFDALQDAFNRLGNLQLLDGPTNVSKQQDMPLEWAEKHYPNADARLGYLAANDMHDLPKDLHGFADFFDARRDRMRERLRGLLAAPTQQVMQSHWGPPAGTSSEPTLEPVVILKQPHPSSSSTRRAFARSLSAIPDGPVEFRHRGVIHFGRVEGSEIVLTDGRRFASPSAAAEAVNGHSSANGWKAWTRDGRTLAELHP